MLISHCSTKLFITVLTITLLNALSLPLGHECLASESVSARYTQKSGGVVKLLITVKPPAPSSLILEQSLPQGTKLIASTPPARTSKQGSKVKWLFKNLSHGTLMVQMKISPADAARYVNGTLRYKTSGHKGGMQEISISE